MDVPLVSTINCLATKLHTKVKRLKLFMASFTPMFWKVNRSDPAVFPLSSFGWSLINPLLYPRLDEHIQRTHQVCITKPRVSAILNDQAIVHSADLLFLIPDNDPPGEKFSEIGALVGKLRHLSKQLGVAKGVPGLSMTANVELAQLPVVTFPDVVPNVKIAVLHTIVDTAITLKHLEAADIMQHDVIPFFDTVLLDALHAYTDGEYWRAILYAALAVEILAATKLDEHYERLIQQGGPETDVRLISLPQAGGKVVVKDPVYEKLRQRADFAQLLHERPLYLLKRSLLLDNEHLYRLAIKLYSTRNKIVHHGMPPLQGDHLSINHVGALAAVECAVGVFKWFGEDNGYVISKGLQFYHAHLPLEDTA